MRNVTIKDKSLDEIRSYGFPYPTARPELFQQLLEFNAENLLDGTTIRRRKCFLPLATQFFPHMFATPVSGMRTPLEAWNNDLLLRRAIGLACRYTKNPTLSTLYSKLMVVSGVQCVSNFRPEVAKLIYNRFAAGGRVYDFSAGYGGRLVGFLASTAKEYYGTDVNEQNFIGYEKILQYNNKPAYLFNQPSEELLLEPEFFDLAFSSPPYYKKEIYSGGLLQSCNRYPTYAEWKICFLEKTIKNIYSMLKPGGYFVINVADVKINNTTYPLVEDTKSLTAGFELYATWFYALQKTIGTRKFHKDKTDDYKREPILIFKK